MTTNRLIEVWIPLSLIEYDEFAGTAPQNVWNNSVVGEVGDSDRINRIVRWGIMGTGEVSRPQGIQCALFKQPNAQFFTPRNGVLPVKWVLELCDAGTLGEVYNWECGLRLSAAAFDRVVPNGVKGADGVVTWRNWVAPNHQAYEGGGFFWIPSWAYDGVGLPGSECVIAENESGLNLWPRQDFNQAINDGSIVPVT